MENRNSIAVIGGGLFLVVSFILILGLSAVLGRSTSNQSSPSATTQSTSSDANVAGETSEEQTGAESEDDIPVVTNAGQSSSSRVASSSSSAAATPVSKYKKFSNSSLSFEYDPELYSNVSENPGNIELDLKFDDYFSLVVYYAGVGRQDLSYITAEKFDALRYDYIRESHKGTQIDVVYAKNGVKFKIITSESSYEGNTIYNIHALGEKSPECGNVEMVLLYSLESVEEKNKYLSEIKNMISTMDFTPKNESECYVQQESYSLPEVTYNVLESCYWQSGNPYLENGQETHKFVSSDMIGLPASCPNHYLEVGINTDAETVEAEIDGRDADYQLTAKNGTVFDVYKKVIEGFIEELLGVGEANYNATKSIMVKLSASKPLDVYVNENTESDFQKVVESIDYELVDEPLEQDEYDVFQSSLFAETNFTYNKTKLGAATGEAKSEVIEDITFASGKAYVGLGGIGYGFSGDIEPELLSEYNLVAKNGREFSVILEKYDELYSYFSVGSYIDLDTIVLVYGSASTEEELQELAKELDKLIKSMNYPVYGSGSEEFSTMSVTPAETLEEIEAASQPEQVAETSTVETVEVQPAATPADTESQTPLVEEQTEEVATAPVDEVVENQSEQSDLQDNNSDNSTTTEEQNSTEAQEEISEVQELEPANESEESQQGSDTTEDSDLEITAVDSQSQDEPTITETNTESEEAMSQSAAETQIEVVEQGVE